MMVEASLRRDRDYPLREGAFNQFWDLWLVFKSAAYLANLVLLAFRRQTTLPFCERG